jgi:SAM-dependent methyltransferase
MSNVDESYTAPLLASMYDEMNPWGPSDDFYYQLALDRGGAVLDIGCGTGTLACRLAEAGLRVWGVVPSRPATKHPIRTMPGSSPSQPTFISSTGMKSGSLTAN